jgi:chemotaxis protein CheC
LNALTEIELDALAEIFNIGAGRSALSLSELIGEEVHLSVPSIRIINPNSDCSALVVLGSGRFGAVSQQFTGPLQATGTLVLTEQHVLEIVHNMMGSQASSEQLVELEHEAMCELGNIVLYACLTGMADMLGIALEGSLPDYHVVFSDELLLPFNQPVTQSVLLMSIDLLIEKHHEQKKLILALKVSSLSNLSEHIKRFIGVLS